MKLIVLNGWFSGKQEAEASQKAGIASETSEVREVCNDEIVQTFSTSEQEPEPNNNVVVSGNVF